jgi:hypothetical protein
MLLLNGFCVSSSSVLNDSTISRKIIKTANFSFIKISTGTVLSYQLIITSVLIASLIIQDHRLLIFIYLCKLSYDDNDIKRHWMIWSWRLSVNELHKLESWLIRMFCECTLKLFFLKGHQHIKFKQLTRELIEMILSVVVFDSLGLCTVHMHMQFFLYFFFHSVLCLGGDYFVRRIFRATVRIPSV